MKKKIVLIGESIPDETVNIIESLGYKFIKLPQNNKLSKPVAAHPDMSVCKIGDRLICSRDYYNTAGEILEYAAKESGMKVVVSSKNQSETYPNDIGYNVLVTKNAIISKTENTSDEIISSANELGLQIIRVKQGYTACSVLKVTDNAIITADKNIAETAGKIGIDVLLISSGGIFLSGYDYGFIGGASCRLDEKIIFFGNVKLHDNFLDILSFTQKFGVEIVSGSYALSDYGGGIVL